MPELSERAKKLIGFIQKNASDSFSKFALALELDKAGFPSEKVEALFISILKQEPTYQGLYYHYGAWLEKQNRLQEALEIYDKGISLARNTKDTHALSELLTAKNNAEL